jgi:hypothetical protein
MRRRERRRRRSRSRRRRRRMRRMRRMRRRMRRRRRRRRWRRWRTRRWRTRRRRVVSSGYCPFNGARSGFLWLLKLTETRVRNHTFLIQSMRGMTLTLQ